MIQFHKSSVKLAGLYLGIILAISLLFSVSIYQVSVKELERGIRRPIGGQNIRPDINISDNLRVALQAERVEAYEQAKSRIVANLIVVNISILIAGGLLSYYLAYRTLKPIEDAHAAQSRFASNASHELRTPITAMRSEIEVSLLDPNLTLKQAKLQLGSNIEELEKLTELSEALLRLAQLEETALHHDLVPVSDIITTAGERIQVTAQQKSIKLTLPKKVSGSVRGDKASLIEALVTVLDNAVKYSGADSTVKVRAVSEGSSAQITITDSGVGINENDQKRIFDRFFRADSSRTKQSASGFGLGLAIASGIVSAHSGTIAVSSQPGKGSTFTITLPLA